MKAKPQKSKSEKLKGPDCPEQGNVDNQGYMEITRPAVICSDPDQLVQFVLRERGMNPSTSMVLTGMVRVSARLQYFFLTKEITWVPQTELNILKGLPQKTSKIALLRN